MYSGPAANAVDDRTNGRGTINITISAGVLTGADAGREIARALAQDERTRMNGQVTEKAIF